MAYDRSGNEGLARRIATSASGLLPDPTRKLVARIVPTQTRLSGMIHWDHSNFKAVKWCCVDIAKHGPKANVLID